MDIEKLKQKILDLAIRGKLVPQDPNDEPASVLIEKIRKEKEELIKQGKIKRDKNESYIYKGSDNCYYEKIGNEVRNITDELPFEIPETWCWCRLKNISVSISAGGDKPNIFSKQPTNECNIPIYSNGIENNGLFGFTNTAKIFNECITISARGTIGFTCVRKKPFVPIVRLITVIPENIIMTEYLKIVCDALLEKGEGTSTPQLTVPFIKEKLIPLPPVNEQNKIINNISIILIKLNSIFDEVNDLNVLIDKTKNKILDYYFGEDSCYKSYYENKLTLGDVLSYEQPWKYTVGSTNYDDSYKTPVLTPGKTFILGYTNEKTGIYDVGRSKVIIFDDFTTASRLIDFNFKVKSSAMKILTSVDSDKFDIEYLFYLLQTINIISNTHKRYWISEYMPISLKIHNINEQKKIVNKINTMFTILNSMSNSI